MRCPNCNARITQTHYDPIYEWFECSKCEGCFTYDEILEGGGEAVVDRKEKPKAKGKRRRAERQEDEELADEMVEAIATTVQRRESGTRHRDELPTKQVVNIWADEIQQVYEDMGFQLDEANAQDKALTIWRIVHFYGGAVAREQPVAHALCKEHR